MAHIAARIAARIPARLKEFIVNAAIFAALIVVCWLLFALLPASQSHHGDRDHPAGHADYGDHGGHTDHADYNQDAAIAGAIERVGFAAIDAYREANALPPDEESTFANPPNSTEARHGQR